MIMKNQTRPDKITLGRTEPDYSIDLTDLFEIDMIEAEKELMRRDHAEGRIKSHPSIIFSVEYMRGRQKEDTLYYLQCIGKLKGEIRNHMNANYIKHLKLVSDYESRRSKIKNAFICRNRYPELYKKYRISKICIDRYHRFFKTIWTRPSMKGKLVNQYRCLSCGIRMPKNVNIFMCNKCKNNESEKFHDRGKWKTDILDEEIGKVPSDPYSFKTTFKDDYHHIKREFLRIIKPIREKRRKDFEREYQKKRWKDPDYRKSHRERHARWVQTKKGRESIKKWRDKNREKWNLYHREYRRKNKP
jgi:hypothetical protein